MKCLNCSSTGKYSWLLFAEDFLSIDIETGQFTWIDQCFCDNCMLSLAFETKDYLALNYWSSIQPKKEENKMKNESIFDEFVQETVFTIKILAEINSVEISGYGFTAEIKKGLSFNHSTQQYFTKYSVLFERQVIALSQAELRKYIMFLEYVEFYLENLNA